MGYCKVPDCNKPTENKDTGLCATHSKAMRKIVTTPIRRVSEKMQKSLNVYDEKRKKFLQRNPRCAVYPMLKSTQVHHMKGRIGALLLDERYWLPVSDKAHVEITNNPKWAISKGYSVSRETQEKEPTI